MKMPLEADHDLSLSTHHRWHRREHTCNGIRTRICHRTPKGVDYDVVGHRYFMSLSDNNLEVRRIAMATNGEWKVLVDILYCVA